jgi:hypothetical protein
VKILINFGAGETIVSKVQRWLHDPEFRLSKFC